MGWLAFLDIVGSKESTRSDSHNLRLTFDQRIRRFQDTIGSVTLRTKTMEARFFSDSAYLQAPELRTLVEALRNVEFQLVKESIYFKCAVLFGELEDRPWTPKGSSLGTKDKKRVQGYGFGREAVAAFEMQEAYAGIGTTVIGNDSSNHEDLLDCSDLLTVTLQFPKTFNSTGSKLVRRRFARVLTPSFAIPMAGDTEDVSEMTSLANKIFSDMRMASLSYPPAVPKYITFMINIVQSSVVKDLESDPTSSTRILKLPTMIDDVLNNTRWDYFSQIVGFNELLWCCLGRIHEHLHTNRNLDDETRGRLDMLISRVARRALPKRADVNRPSFLELPAEILSSEAKNFILDRWISEQGKKK